MRRRLLEGLVGRDSQLGAQAREAAIRELLADGSAAAAGLLAGAAIAIPDRAIAARLLAAAGLLQRQEAVDEVCRLWYRTGDPRLRRLIFERGWIASPRVEGTLETALVVAESPAQRISNRRLATALLRLARSPDDADREAALSHLRALPPGSAQDEVSIHALEGDAFAMSIARAAGYQPLAQDARVAFFLLAGRAGECAALDPRGDALASYLGWAGPAAIDAVLDAAWAADPSLLFRAVGAGAGPDRSTLVPVPRARGCDHLWSALFKIPLGPAARVVVLASRAGHPPADPEAGPALARLSPLACQALDLQPYPSASIAPESPEWPATRLATEPLERIGPRDLRQLRAHFEKFPAGRAHGAWLRLLVALAAWGNRHEVAIASAGEAPRGPHDCGLEP
ncbi:MAG: hypothetical protein FJZ01_02020 [Candidatus Sericytochromatia bacterium]|nr:hypothetical protein [Candidatus Tanganyikabacteria bacterium]